MKDGCVDVTRPIQWEARRRKNREESKTEQEASQAGQGRKSAKILCFGLLSKNRRSPLSRAGRAGLSARSALTYPARNYRRRTRRLDGGAASGPAQDRRPPGGADLRRTSPHIRSCRGSRIGSLFWSRSPPGAHVPTLSADPASGAGRERASTQIAAPATARRDALTRESGAALTSPPGIAMNGREFRLHRRQRPGGSGAGVAQW